jgi:hypothetical protein
MRRIYIYVFLGNGVGHLVITVRHAGPRPGPAVCVERGYPSGYLSLLLLTAISYFYLPAPSC